ncbi:MAG: hypothetical protein ABWZ17_00355 [Candidatus Binatia bacterium]
MTELAKIGPRASPYDGYSPTQSAGVLDMGPYSELWLLNSVVAMRELQHKKLPGTAFGPRQPGGNGEASMKFYRLYSADDGRSRFEQLDSSQSSEFFNATRPARGLLFRNDFAPHIVNWHRAPRRRWVITLSGTVDIGLGDGTGMTFGPGDVFLAEDMTGQGHTATPYNWVRAYVNVE